MSSSTTDTPPAAAEPVALATGPEHTRQEWEAAAAAVVRRSGGLAQSAPDEQVWEALARTTLDGITVTPLGVADAGSAEANQQRPTRHGGWDVRSLIDASRGARAATEATDDLEGGVTSLWVRVEDPADLATALRGVLLDVAPVVVQPRGDAGAVTAAATALAGLAGEGGLHADSNLGFDPWRGVVSGVDAPATTDDLLAVAAAATAAGVRGIVVDGTVVHDAGASDVQELAYVLAAAVDHLRRLTEAGTDVVSAAALMEFRIAAGADQFPTIAKFRALRRLWSRVMELSGVADAAARSARIHAVTSRPMMTRYDPWVNMLRTTVASFAAGVGGADAVTVLPFDSALGVPDAFGRRIARNTSVLLIEESHLARVVDPAGGAHAVERLTADIATAAWSHLGQIDEAGGLAAVLADGSWHRAVDDVVAEREHLIARRSLPLTGLSEFPNLAETLPEREPHPEGGWDVRSYGHAFEAMRDTPPGAPVFLATMGTVAAHTARATFAGNLFAAGGVATVNPGRCDDVEAVVAAYRAAEAPAVVCLAGTDAAYAEWGADLVAALRAAGARWVILAGRPVDGVTTDDTCAMGVDALEFLTRTRERLS